MKTIDCSTTVTPEELMQAHIALGHQSVLPVTKSVAEKFLKETPLMATCPDIKYVAMVFFDWIGANQEYEEGAEETW